MTAKEFYNQKNNVNSDKVGTFEEFICEFEEKWLQYANEETKVKAYFGNVEVGMQIFNEWKTGNDYFKDEIKKAFPEPYRFE